MVRDIIFVSKMNAKLPWNIVTGVFNCVIVNYISFPCTDSEITWVVVAVRYFVSLLCY